VNISQTIDEARGLKLSWIDEYNGERPHKALGRITPWTTGEPVAQNLLGHRLQKRWDNYRMTRHRLYRSLHLMHRTVPSTGVKGLLL